MFGRKWKKIAKEAQEQADKYKEILDDCASQLNKSSYSIADCNQPSDIPLVISAMITQHARIELELDNIADEQRTKFHTINHTYRLMKVKIKEVLDNFEHTVAFEEAEVK